MERLMYSMYLGSLVILFVKCHEDILPLENRMDDLEEELVDFKDDVTRIEKRVMNKVDVAKVSLRTELEKHIKHILKEAMADILQGESIEEMVRSQVMTEIRQLRRGNHQMKRQLHNVMKSLKYSQEDSDMYREAFLKGERDAGVLKMYSKCGVEKVFLETELQKCQSNIELLEMKQCHNITCKRTEENASRKSVSVQDLTLPGSTPSSSLEASQPTTIAVTTAKPEEKRSWILIGAGGSSLQHPFRKLNIHSNTLQTYSHMNLKYISSLTYASKLNKLFIGFESPDKVISSNLYGSNVKTMREDVECWGMAVDEDRQILFMSLWVPRFSISRMDTDGKHYTPMVDWQSSYGSWPRSIVVDSKEQRIYACNKVKLFMLTYDGRILETLATGENMNAVELDNTGRFLYYNDDSKLMKMSLSTNISSEVTTLSNVPWNFKYYNSTLYYSSYSSSSISYGTVRAVTLRYKIIKYPLKTIRMNNIRSLCICLIP